MIRLCGGPALLELSSQGCDLGQLEGLTTWSSTSRCIDPWSQSVCIDLRLSDDVDTEHYRSRFIDYIEFPNLEWRRASRYLRLSLPRRLNQYGCWTMTLAHRHALLAGLVAASQGSNWRCLHGALVVLEDQSAVVIVGHSGAGKSTLARRLGGDVRGDEIVALRSSNEGVWVRGTAIPGELACRDFTAHQLRAVIVPEHGDEPECVITPVTPAESVKNILDAVVRFEPNRLIDDFIWLDEWLPTIPVCRFRWRLQGQLPYSGLAHWLRSLS